MNKAIDVVLLPSEEMMDYAIKINEELLKYFDKKIILNNKSCLPHISLAMGCIDTKDVSEIADILKTISQQFSPMELEATEIHANKTPAGKKVSVLKIENTTDLQLLHETITKGLEPYLSFNATAGTVYNPSEVGETTLDWINNYKSKASFENFSPHITVGYGETDVISLPVKFTASTLALCHLGNHCTCRDILTSVELRA